jgi:molybdopterin converting factor small subunit
MSNALLPFRKKESAIIMAARAYELADKSTVRDLVKKTELNEDEIKIIFINHREEALETVLKEGDQVALSPKAGGM